VLLSYRHGLTNPRTDEGTDYFTNDLTNRFTDRESVFKSHKITDDFANR
jgi:hypothetical protein